MNPVFSTGFYRAPTAITDSEGWSLDQEKDPTRLLRIWKICYIILRFQDTYIHSSDFFVSGQWSEKVTYWIHVTYLFYGSDLEPCRVKLRSFIRCSNRVFIIRRTVAHWGIYQDSYQSRQTSLKLYIIRLF